ncbi:head-tail connector protein [Aliiroseovarius sp.]|uniref:head-tail connector protein n=1 Tax=Aliiroseovarius sp. TaxID=1872442 RepID=UPI003BA9803D
MKVFVQRTPVSAELPFDLDDLKQHMRVAHDLEDDAVRNMGLTAAAELEQFAQISLLKQDITVTVFEATFSRSVLTFPIGPMAEGSAPIIVMDGENFTSFEHVGGNRPAIRFLCDYLLLAPGKMEIRYQAGFGGDASYIPADLAQALMDQTALHYDGRSPMHSKDLTTSPHLARIGARYRGVQL